MVLCSLSRKKWKEIWMHCQSLAPGFVPTENDWIAKVFVKILGVYRGILFYEQAKRLSRFFGVHRHHRA